MVRLLLSLSCPPDVALFSQDPKGLSGWLQGLWGGCCVIRSCRLGVSVGGGEFRIILLSHLQDHLQGHPAPSLSS